MKVYKSIDSAQHDEWGVAVVDAAAGDLVRFSNIYGEFEITITHEALECDCNKGVLCPLNPQKQVQANILRF